MASGLLMWVIGVLICIGVFLNGLRFSRMSENPWASKSLLGMPVKGSDLTVAQVQRMGRIQMIGAPVFLIFWTLLSFGVLGPINGIQTIKLN